MPKKNPPPADSPSFEDALGELEQIVHELEEGRSGLDESLKRYERGVKLLRRCYGLLEGAERKIELLSGVDSQGNPITRPLEDVSTLQRDQQEHAGRDSTHEDNAADA